MFMTGYKQGKTSLLKILKNGTIDRIINSFSIVGLMVVGSMAATRVTVNTPLAIKIGEGSTTIQSVSRFSSSWIDSIRNYYACMVDVEEENQYSMDYYCNFLGRHHWLLHRNSWICRVRGEYAKVW